MDVKNILEMGESERVRFVLSNIITLIRDIRVQRALIKDKNDIIRESILMFTLEKEIILECINDHYVPIRVLVARKTEDQNALRLLANDSSVFVCIEVAKNRKTEKDVLGSLLERTFPLGGKDDAKKLRLSVLGNPMIQVYQDVFHKFIQSGSAEPEFILEVLRFNYISRDSFIYLLKKEKNPSLIKKILTHKEFPADLLEPINAFYPNEKKISEDRALDEFESILLKMFVLEHYSKISP